MRCRCSIGARARVPDRLGFAALSLLATGLLLPGLLTGPSLDAAVFLDVATHLRAGDTLYVDAWDHKPPGIYLILALGQSLLPFVDPWAVAWLLSLVATVLTGVGAMLVLRRLGVSSGPRWVAAGIAVAVMAQYLTSLGGGLTEPFAAAFLVGAMALGITGTGPRRTVAVGALLAVAVLVAIPAVAGGLAVGIMVIALAQRRVGVTGLLVVGGLVPIGATAAWMASTGSLGAGMDAVVGYSIAYRQVNESVGGDLSSSVAAWTVLGTMVATVPALLGAVAGFRASGDRRLIAILSVGWIALSVALFVYQGRFFAHYAIPLAIPLAVLAGFGVERTMTVAELAPDSGVRVGAPWTSGWWYRSRPASQRRHGVGTRLAAQRPSGTNRRRPSMTSPNPLTASSSGVPLRRSTWRPTGDPWADTATCTRSLRRASRRGP